MPLHKYEKRRGFMQIDIVSLFVGLGSGFLICMIISKSTSEMRSDVDLLQREFDEFRSDEIDIRNDILDLKKRLNGVEEGFFGCSKNRVKNDG